MIHIRKSKDGQFYVIQTGGNGEPLDNGSETFTQKKNAWVNIAAQGKNFNAGMFYVQDETTKKKAVYTCNFDENEKFIKRKS